MSASLGKILYVFLYVCFQKQQPATSATSNERVLQRVTSNFLQRATSATTNKQILQRVTSDFLKWATSATSKEQVLQRVTSNKWISTRNKQRVNFNE